MDWRIKGAIQKALEYVPYGERINHRLQQRGGLRRFERECDIKVDDWRIAMGQLRTTKVSLLGARLVEIGTGWYPTFPVCMWLAGADRVYTFDLVRHIEADLTRRLADQLSMHVELIARESGRALDEVEGKRAMLAARLHRGASIADATDGAIDYRAPADATRTGFDPGSIDLVFSNSVLEHVYPDVLPAMFDEAMRILRPGGAAMHSVNCGDHYAYFDRKISQLHYLQFSESEWRLWNNEFQYQNRLRAKEFLAFALRAGFSIALDASEVRPSRLADLDKIEVAPEFAGYTREELALTNIDFVAKKPA